MPIESGHAGEKQSQLWRRQRPGRKPLVESPQRSNRRVIEACAVNIVGLAKSMSVMSDHVGLCLRRVHMANPPLCLQ
jgi:hypothetical protein